MNQRLLPCFSKSNIKIFIKKISDLKTVRLLLVYFFSLSIFACDEHTEVLFCPEDGCAKRLISEIDSATLSVHVAIAYFNDEEIATALIEAYKRGIDVRVIGEADENTPNGINYQTIEMIQLEGVSYRDDGNEDTMHNKFTIIDTAVVLTGSYNYTFSGDNTNDENMEVIFSKRIAENFEAEFQELWEAGVEEVQ